MKFVDEETKSQLFFEKHGDGRHKLMVIHGYGMDHRSMEWAVQMALGDQDNVQIIYVDLPGMGKSTDVELSLNADKVVDILVRLLDYIADGDSTVDLLGFSYGGYLVQGMLSKASERIGQFMLLAPAYYGDFSQRSLPEQVNFDLEITDPIHTQEYGDHYLQLTGIPSLNGYSKFAENVQVGFNDANNEYLDVYSKTGYVFKDESRVHHTLVGNKGVIVLSMADHIVGYKDILSAASNYPETDYILLRNAGHIIHVDMADKVVQIIQSFFNY